MKFFLFCIAHLWSDDLLGYFGTDRGSTLINETQSAGKGSFTENGTWIAFDSKQRNLEVVSYTSANDLGRIFASTIDTDSVKSKNQDKEDGLDDQMQLIWLDLNGVETSTNAQSAAQEVWSLLCAGGVHEPDP